MLLLLLSLSGLHSFSASSAGKVGGSLATSFLTTFCSLSISSIFCSSCSRSSCACPFGGCLGEVSWLVSPSKAKCFEEGFAQPSFLFGRSVSSRASCPRGVCSAQQLNMSLPEEACRLQASFPFVPLLMLKLWRGFDQDRVKDSVWSPWGLHSWHRGSCPILPSPDCF